MLCGCRSESGHPDRGKTPYWTLTKEDNNSSTYIPLTVEGAVFTATIEYSGIWRCGYWGPSSLVYVDFKVWHVRLKVYFNSFRKGLSTRNIQAYNTPE